MCIAKGSAITGEHSVGVEKINEMRAQSSEDGLGQFHAVKAAFDLGGC